MNERIAGDSPKSPENFYLTKLRTAFDSGDLALLRSVVNGIQTYVHGTHKQNQLGQLDDKDIRTLMETGRGMITVGIGTQGERIMIRDGELYMPIGDERSEKYGREFHLNFQRLFDLPDIKDLRVKF